MNGSIGHNQLEQLTRLACRDSSHDPCNRPSRPYTTPDRLSYHSTPALHPTSQPPTMSSDTPVKLGIIGYGFSTTVFHLPFIVPNHSLQIYAFLQRDPSLLLQRAPTLPSRTEDDDTLNLSPITPTRTRRASLATDVFPVRSGTRPPRSSLQIPRSRWS